MRAWDKAKRIWRSTKLYRAIEIHRQIRDFRYFFSKGSSPKMLIFGDSIAAWVARDDTDEKSFEDLIKERGRKFANLLVVAGRAYHPKIFYHYSRLITKLPHQPHLVILPINLRAFSPSWHLNPEFQYFELISKLIAKHQGRRMLSMGTHSVSATESAVFEAIPLKYPGKPLLTVGDYHRISRNKPLTRNDPQWAVRLDHVFTFHYMYPIYQQNGKLSYLCKVAKLFRDLNIPILMYITPINYQAGVKYVGERFLEVVNENIHFVRDRLSKCGIEENLDVTRPSGTIENYAYKFPSSAFATPHNSTEHLRFEERLSLVNDLLEIGRKMIVA